MAARTVCRINHVHGTDVCKDVVNGAGRGFVADSPLETARKSYPGFARVVKTADSEVVA